MKRKHGIALFAAVAIAATAAGATYQLWPRKEGAAASGSGVVVEQVYAARLVDLNGREQTLAQWRGQVLVVNFWATWCAPCREEIPGFVRMQERYGPRGLQFVGLPLAQREGHGIAQGIDEGVNLGRQSAARAPDRLIFAPFLRAPALC